jgi:phosphoribosylformylglycinamidine synthase
VERTASPPAGWDAAVTVTPPESMPDLGQTLLALLGTENLRSRAFVYSQFDHTVRGDTLLPPGAGDAAVIRLRGRTDAIAVTLDGNSRMTALDPRQGAAMIVAEAARNLACVGARPLAVTDGLNFADPERPDVFWQFTEAVEGLRAACLAMNTPVVGGNVSFYNETGEQRVAPTPTVGMVGHLTDARNARGVGWVHAGDTIALLGRNRGAISGSEYQTLTAGRPCGRGPNVDLVAERALVEFLIATAERGLLHSAHDVSLGGLLVAIAECCLASADGLTANIDRVPPDEPGQARMDELLFSEEGARAVVSFDRRHTDAIADLAREHGVPIAPMGTVDRDVLRVTDCVHLPLDCLRRAWCPGEGLAGLQWPAGPLAQGSRA